MKKLSILSLLIIAISCSRLTNYRKELQQHPFNQEIISKLPLFDALRQQILSFYDSLDFENGYDPYTNTSDMLFYYNHFFNSTEQYHKIPEQLYENIVPICNEIGEGNIDGFTILKDSTMVFWISSSKASYNHDLKIVETLYWYPDSIPKAEEYPRKDTMLNKQWKLQVWYDQKKSLM